MKPLSLLLSARLWVVLAFVFGILPIGLSSTEMWDGVVGIHALITNDWMTLENWLLDSNWYLTYGLFRTAEFLHRVSGLDYWIFFKLWFVLMVLGIAWETSQLAQRVFEIPASIAAWLPAVVFSFPLWYIFFSYTPMLGHLTCVWLALAGYRFFCSDKRLAAGIGLIFLAGSFQLASNCAFVLALELGRWVLSKNRLQWAYGRSALLLVVTFAVFLATRLIWPPVGTYIGYNKFLDPFSLLSWPTYAKYSAFFATWLVLLAPMLAGLWWAFRSRHMPALMLWQALRKDRVEGGVCVLLILAACAPYIAVGVGSPLFTVTLAAPGFASVSAVLAGNATLGPAGLWFGGWGARQALLLMIPLVLTMGWLASLSCRLTPGNTPAELHLSYAFIITVALCLSIGIPGHWAKLKRLAKERTIVTLMADKPVLPGGYVDLLLSDREDFVSAIYETNYLLLQASKSTRWAALMLPENQAVLDWGNENRRFTLAQAPEDQPKIAGLNLMNEYDWNKSCKTTARIKLPSFDIWDVLWRTEHAPQQLPRAEVLPVSSTCSDANTFWRGTAF